MSDELKDLLQDLKAQRKKLLQIDHDILRLIAQRFEQVDRISKTKSQLNYPIEDTEYEVQHLNNLINEACSLKLSQQFTTDLYQLLVQYSKYLQSIGGLSRQED